MADQPNLAGEAGHRVVRGYEDAHRHRDTLDRRLDRITPRRPRR